MNKHLLPLLMLPLLLNSCQALNPAFFQMADDVLTDGVIQVQVDKEAFEGNRKVSVNIEISEPTK